MLYDHDTNGILIKRDVIFDESCIASYKSFSSALMYSSIMGDPTIEENSNMNLVKKRLLFELYKIIIMVL